MAQEVKRVLVVCQHYWPENFRITDIAEGFVQSGYEVDVLCGLPNYPKGEYFDGYSYTRPRRQTHNGVEIFRAGEILRRGNTSLRIFLNYISYPLSSLFNLPRLAQRHYDAVLCYQLSPVLMLLPAIIMAKFRKIPLTAYVLDLWPENLYSVLPIKGKAARGIAGGVSHFLYRRCDRLIAMSDSQKLKLCEQTPKAQITVIPQYCEDFYAQDLQDAAVCSKYKDNFVILFTGNFSPAQDLELLIACARSLRDNKLSDIRFVLLGDGMSREQIEAGVEREGLSEFFDFVGQKEPREIPAYFAVASALFAALVPSEDIGLTVPAKIASYMAGARPLLTAMDGEGNAAVESARCGLTSPSGDSDALYANIMRMYSMPKQELCDMGDRAFEYYKAHYSRSANLQAIIDFVL